MRTAAIALLVITLVAGAIWIRSRSRINKAPRFESTEQLVEWLATQAVHDASENSQVNLDYSVESIKQVEKILGGVHDQYVKNHKSVSVTGLGSAYGAYIGEVIRKSEPNAHWLRDDEMGEKTYPIVWGPRQGHSYPMAWCAHRIENGDEDNVWLKYYALKNDWQKKPSLSVKATEKR